MRMEDPCGRQRKALAEAAQECFQSINQKQNPIQQTEERDCVRVQRKEIPSEIGDLVQANQGGKYTADSRSLGELLG